MENGLMVAMVLGGAALLLFNDKGPGSMKGENILLMGDSLANGLRGPFAARVREAGGGITVAAIDGSSSPRWAGLAAELSRHKTVVVVSLGGNEFGSSVGPTTTDVIIKEVREAGAKLVYIAPPPIPAADTYGVEARWRSAADAVVETQEVVGEYRSDGIHPTWSELRRLAGEVERVVVSVI